MAVVHAVRDSLAVAVGAALGANVRYWTGVWFKAMGQTSFPWSTFAINVVGSLAIGVVAAFMAHRPVLLGWQLFVVVGVLGGFTTFSSFSLDIFYQLEKGQFLPALGYAFGSLLLGLAFCAAGYYGVSRLLASVG